MLFVENSALNEEKLLSENLLRINQNQKVFDDVICKINVHINAK